MNCDELFDHLTCSAAPSVPAADAAVAEHLAGCPRCRSLAEVLQPALDLFRAAASETCVAEPLPAMAATDWMQADAEDTTSVDSLPTQSSPATTIGSRLPPRKGMLSRRLAGALAAGILAAGTLWGVVAAAHRESGSVRSRLPGAENTAGAKGFSEPGSPSVFESLRLAPACFNGRVPARWLGKSADSTSRLPLEESDRGSLACCTLCHAAGGPAAASCDAVQIALSCQLCHSNK